MNVNQQNRAPQQENGYGPTLTTHQESGDGPTQNTQPRFLGAQPRLYPPSGQPAIGSAANNNMADEPVKPPIFKGFSPQLENILRTAFANAKTKVHAALQKLQTSGPDDNYKTWFGTPTPDNVEKVERVFTNMDTSMAHDQYTIQAAKSQGSAAAWVNPAGPHEINITPRVLNDDSTPDDAKAILVHELSHFEDIGGTDDHVYGPLADMKLADDSPNEAVDNADNYSMFIAFQDHRPVLQHSIPQFVTPTHDTS